MENLQFYMLILAGSYIIPAKYDSYSYLFHIPTNIILNISVKILLSLWRPKVIIPSIIGLVICYYYHTNPDIEPKNIRTWILQESGSEPV